MKSRIALTPRLEAAASLVGSGSFADIGTDHAYLAIKLALERGVDGIASDLREGPCERARKNVRQYGLDDKIKIYCRSGLDSVEEFSPDNIIICGMGGELIAEILEKSEYPKASRCRLILQPMSMQDELRRYLCREGFAIQNELVIYDSGKYYQLISAKYTGDSYTLDEVEALLGQLNLKRAAESLSDTDRGWLECVLKAAKSRFSARQKSDVGTSSPEQLTDRRLIERIEAIFQAQCIEQNPQADIKH